jgi:hypothetical protein
VGYSFSFAGNVLGLGGLVYSDLANAVANNDGWIDSKGNYRSTDLLQRQANGKFVRGVQGYRNGYSSALKTASNYKVAGAVVGI